MRERIEAYFSELGGLAGRVEATGRDGGRMALAEALEWAVRSSKAAHAAGHKLMFIGNGGSATIASHMAIDFTKNGNVRALAFNDSAALTCLGNDLGYENVFAKQVEAHARAGDLLVAISSSGRSPNILRGVERASAMGCKVLTLSGFSAENPLRRMGDVNLYVPSGQYGFVEITHLGLCHAILDLGLG